MTSSPSGPPDVREAGGAPGLLADASSPSGSPGLLADASSPSGSPGLLADASSPSGYFALAIGVLSVGAAAILVREANAPALAVSFWRTLIGGSVLFVIVRARGIPFPSGVVLRRALIAGVLLGVHFWSWIASLAMTSVAASVVLVCTQPIFVALLARVFLRESTTTKGALGIAVAFAGAAVIALDAAHGAAAARNGASAANPILGDALALVGAVAIAVYMLVGRGVAGKVDVGAYSATVSLTAAASLLLPLAASALGPIASAWYAGVPEWYASVPDWVAAVPASSTSWFWVVALALGPQLIGHTALNAALARLPAAVVSGSILGEPVIATALAAAFLDEKPGVTTLAGSAVVLVGLALLISPAKRR